MGKALLFMIRIALLVFIVSGIHISDIQAATSPSAEGADGLFFGNVKDINCAAGELKMTGNKGEREFTLGKKIEFVNIKGCDEIRIGGTARVHYSKDNGKYVVSFIKYAPQRTKRTASATEPAPSGSKPNFFMGWIDSIDCEKATLTAGEMKDRKKTALFRFSDSTVFDPGNGIKGCADIRKDSVVSIKYEDKDKEKLIQKIQVMLVKEGKK